MTIRDWMTPLCASDGHESLCSGSFGHEHVGGVKRCVLEARVMLIRRGGGRGRGRSGVVDRFERSLR